MTTEFHPLPLEDYLQTGASKERKQLHKAAFSRRIEHWQYSARTSGLETALAAIAEQFEASIDELCQAEKGAQLQYDIQLEIVLQLEQKLVTASDEVRADSLGREVLGRSCDLAEYAAALYKAKKRLGRAEAILDDKQSQAEDIYAELLAMDEVVQLRETVRKQLEAQRRKQARQFQQRIGITPTAALQAEIQAADMGAYEQGLLKAVSLEERFTRSAAYYARRMVQEMYNGRSPYLGEAPKESYRFRASGSCVYALDQRGNAVARWAVAADGAAYLLKVLQPRGTRYIRRKDQEIKAFDQHGKVLGSYPLTAWLISQPPRRAATALSA